jgi:putative membrane protein
MTPAMVAVFLLGGALIWAYGANFGWSFVRSIWIWIMIVGAIGLGVWQYYLDSARKHLAEGRRVHTERFWRMVNELPFAIAFVIVICVTLKVGG